MDSQQGYYGNVQIIISLEILTQIIKLQQGQAILLDKQSFGNLSQDGRIP
ncbi:UNKNOWN [Stylonychia lemnae]|uniref:Uncharacterized protein n=1 Tax=Stylonychia lemnae TaxID=5949 RepID=A0A078AXX7_STYLE|nr:UNKNOWN [Stylonychia lemnae]|eukprot:CDW86087.1 UNKNOWN [Stylonychia lemnae]